ncbi:MAG: ArgE/DapE family deacylase [Desulfobacterales bacterium]|nr:MAG: ArgE/DapE family deacylase [Desulfobacterales bacterium]
MTELNNKEKQIITATEKLAEDIVDFASRLVAEPSTLGNEISALRVMEAELKKLGLETRQVPIDPAILAEHPGFAPVPWEYDNRYNIVGIRPEGAEGGRSLLLNGHLDVVDPGGGTFWQRDPFVSEIRDGWLYGRGAGDMKAGVAAMTYALKAVETAGFALRAPVTVEAVIEEECSGNGALACIQAGYDAEAVLIPEPFGPTILTHQVGVLWFKVSVAGAARHVLAAGSGVNAIETCFPIISALRGLETELNAAARPEAYRDIDHPLNLNIGIFKGGSWPSSVPDTAEFHGRLSYFPGTQFTDIRQKIIQTVSQAAAENTWLAENPPAVEFYGFRSDGHSADRSLPALATLNNCHRTLTGADAATYVATCTTDLRAFHHFGRSQATCYGPVAESIHGANERVQLDSVMQTAKTYALFMARWCGLVE